jgi:hypothetical protein
MPRFLISHDEAVKRVRNKYDYDISINPRLPEVYALAEALRPERIRVIRQLNLYKSWSSEADVEQRRQRHTELLAAWLNARPGVRQ